jgi:hypothetical protein
MGLSLEQEVMPDIYVVLRKNTQLVGNATQM